MHPMSENHSDIICLFSGVAPLPLGPAEEIDRVQPPSSSFAAKRQSELKNQI